MRGRPLSSFYRYAQGFKEKHEHNGERIERRKKENRTGCVELEILYVKWEFHWVGLWKIKYCLRGDQGPIGTAM